jgi:hypothetical protein
MVMSKNSQVGIASDHFRNKARGIDRCTTSLDRGISYDAYSPLCGMSEVSNAVSHCLQSFQQWILPGSHGVWLFGGIQTLLLLQRSASRQHMEMERNESL